RLRVGRQRSADSGPGEGHGPDRRRDGGPDGCRRGRADTNRYDEGDRAGRLPRARPPAREVGRPFRNVEAAGRDVTNRAHVITVSDGAFHGKREDTSGLAVAAMLKSNHFEVSGPEVVPDERE